MSRVPVEIRILFSFISYVYPLLGDLILISFSKKGYIIIFHPVHFNISKIDQFNAYRLCNWYRLPQVILFFSVFIYLCKLKMHLSVFSICILPQIISQICEDDSLSYLDPPDSWTMLVQTGIGWSLRSWKRNRALFSIPPSWKSLLMPTPSWIRPWPPLSLSLTA
jgi:hypothetical protein